MEQEGGDGKVAASLQCTEKWKTKSITARGKMRGRTDCLPCGMFFSMQKGFTAICVAFLWCRFPHGTGCMAAVMTQRQAAYCHCGGRFLDSESQWSIETFTSITTYSPTRNDTLTSSLLSYPEKTYDHSPTFISSGGLCRNYKTLYGESEEEPRNLHPVMMPAA